MRDGDIFTWSYNEKTLKKRQDKSAAGTMYWCVSRIAVYDEKRDVIQDTYWHSSSDGARFDSQEINDRLVCKFIANFDELISCNRAEFNYYKKADCVDLSHPNASRGNCYIRKGAAKCLDKMRLVLKKNIEHEQHTLDYAKNQVERLESDLEKLTIDSYVPANSEVFIDESEL